MPANKYLIVIARFKAVRRMCSTNTFIKTKNMKNKSKIFYFKCVFVVKCLMLFTFQGFVVKYDVPFCEVMI